MAVQAPPAASEAELEPLRPPLKWAGGKRWLVPRLRQIYEPYRECRLVEPLAGGLAAALGLRPQRALLNDLNPHNINFYRWLSGDLQLDIEMRNEGELYYGHRARFNQLIGDGGVESKEAAELFYYLNHTGYNGLCRFNRKGEFNVPHGRYRRPRILDRDGLRAASAVLRDVELRCEDFEQECAGAGPGDFVYFDPPFHPMSDTSSFTAYTEASFDREDQLRLKWSIDGLRERGVPVMLSNSPHQWVVGLYEGSRYHLARVAARRAINSRGDRRGVIDELLITNYEPPG